MVTGSGLRKLQEALEDNDLLTIFIPSSPTPVTGYIVTVNKKDVIDLPITIEETIRFAVSGGVIVPQNQQSDEVVRLQPGPDSPDKV